MCGARGDMNSCILHCIRKIQAMWKGSKRSWEKSDDGRSFVCGDVQKIGKNQELGVYCVTGMITCMWK